MLSNVYLDSFFLCYFCDDALGYVAGLTGDSMGFR